MENVLYDLLENFVHRGRFFAWTAFNDAQKLDSNAITQPPVMAA